MPERRFLNTYLVGQQVEVGDTVHIPIVCYHAIKNLEEIPFIELNLLNQFIETDIETLEWKGKIS